MAYRIRQKDDSVEIAIRRIAREQLAKAVAFLDDGHDQAAVVHDIRKRCKKLRGLIRLVRPAFDDYTRENETFRDIARLLSGPRDAKVMQDTFDDLVEHFDGQANRHALGQVRRHFTLERKTTLDENEMSKCFAECRDRLAEARDRARGWRIEGDGWSAISGGLRKTYARAGAAAQRARKDPDGETIHDLRKQLKYHWHHIRLLSPIWPEEMEMRAALTRHVSDILGRHHDLSVFESRILESGEAAGTEGDVEQVLLLAKRRRAALEEKAWPAIGRLLSESPDALVNHWSALWRAWRAVSVS